MFCVLFYFEAKNANDDADSLYHKVIVTSVVRTTTYSKYLLEYFEVFVSLVQEQSIQIAQ